MNTAPQIPPRHWLRFARYTIRDGYVLPDPTSAIETYDPWKSFDDARHAGRPPAYESLLRLTHTAPGGRVSDAKLVRWCSRNGVLGVLLTDATDVYVARPEQIGDRSQDNAGFIEYRHGFQGWQQTDPRPCPRPTGITFKKSVGPARTEPLARTWGEFFPGVKPADKERQPYPIPSSHDFWQMYGEPDHRFRDEAQWLLDTVTELADLVRRMSPVEALKASALSARLHATGPLLYNRLVRSLAYAHAAMIACDVLAGRTPTHCRKCGAPFLANAGAATCGYCR